MSQDLLWRFTVSVNCCHARDVKVKPLASGALLSRMATIVCRSFMLATSTQLACPLL